MDVTTIIICLICAIVSLVFYYRYKYNFWSSRGVPGPKPLPILGNLLDFFHLPYFDLFIKYREKYGKLVGLYDGIKPKLVVMDPDLLKDIMVRNFSNFTDRRTDAFDHYLEQKFMFIQEGEEWKKARSLMTPVFSSAKLKAMSHHFSTCSDRAVEEIAKKIKEPIEIITFFNAYTVDIIGRTAFGVKFDAYDPTKTNSLLNSAMSYFRSSTVKTILAFLLPKWFKTGINFSVFNIKAFYDFSSITRVMIEERRKSLQTKAQSYSDFLSIMLDNSGKLDEDQIIANVFLFFSAGFITTALHLDYTVYALAKHPNIQDKVYREIVEACDSDYNKITGDLVSRLEFLDAVSNESLRLYSPSIFTERKVSQDCHLDGIHLPKGTHIFIPTYAIHHSEEYFDNPEKFNPDRFTAENRNSIHPFSFLPFGHGPRNCIGQRYEEIVAKVLLSKMVFKYHISMCDESPEELDFMATNDEGLFTSHDIFLKFELRNNE